MNVLQGYIFLWNICYEMWLFYTYVNVLQEINIVVEYLLCNVAFLHISECTAADVNCFRLVGK